VGLATDISTNTKSVITLTWQDGLSTGGVPIIDYRVSWDASTGNGVSFSVVATNYLPKSYTTTQTLTPGAYYTFIVEARNSVGYSLPSNTFTILAAQPPDTPIAPTTLRSGSSIITNWTAPYNGGTAITSYQVTFRASDGVTFYPMTLFCDGTTNAVRLSRSCTIPSIAFTSLPWNLPWGSFIYAQVTATNI